MKFEDRKIQVLDLIEKNENLEEKLFGDGDKSPLKKLIKSCIKLDFNPLALNKTEKDTLLSLLTVRNAYEILEHKDLLPFIEEKNIDLPIEKIRDSLNNGSYQALHILVKKSPALCHSIYNMEDQSLEDNGKETLQRLKTTIKLQQYIKQNLVVSQQGHRDREVPEVPREVPREITEEQFQKIVADEAKKEEANNFELLQQIRHDQQNAGPWRSFPDSVYCPLNSFDSHEAFQQRQLLPRYSTNRNSFYSHPDLERMPDFSGIEHMPEGPNFF